MTTDSQDKDTARPAIAGGDIHDVRSLTSTGAIRLPRPPAAPSTASTESRRPSAR